MKKAVVIGGGFSGLATAALLAKRGLRVTLLEKNETLGGRAHALKKKGFFFDMGPSWYLMPEVFERFFAFFGKQPSDYYTLVRLDPRYKVYFDDQTSVTMTDYLENNEAAFEKLEPGAAEKLKLFLADMGKIYQITTDKLIFQDIWSLKALSNPMHVKDALKLLNTFRFWESWDALVGRYFSNEKIKKILSFSSVFLGGSPFNTPSLYSMLTWADFKGGVWYPKGGMIQLVSALESLAREHGVTIHTNSEVTSMIIEDGKVTGVNTADQRWDADVVVAATDMPFVETQLLPKEYQTWPEEYWKKRTMGISSLLIYLGLNSELKGTVHHSMYFSRDWQKNFAEIFEKKVLPEDPSFYISIRSKTDRSIVPPHGEEVVVLVPLGAGTKVSKAQLAIYAEKVIHRLEKVLGQRITPHIVVKELFGPQEFAKTYNAFEGTALGLSHTLDQSLWGRPQNRSQKVDELYYAGQYTNPGVGVPMALISAELVAGMIAPQSESANAIFERGSVTYYYSSLFFRGQTKSDVFDLYAYVRTVDDCVDILPAQVEKFDSLWAQTQDAWHGKSVESDVVTKFVHLAKRKKFSWEWIDAFWTAMRSDLHKTSYRRFAELERYMYGSAEVIGLMMSRILNLPKEAAEAAQLQGKAMQYVNFIRDVLEDTELGRNYLGYDEKTAKDPVAWSAFIRKEIAKYRDIQRQAEAGYRFIPRRYLIPIRTAAEMYKWTADQIEKDPMIVWQKKIKPSKTRVITQLLKNCLR